jgi:hypothetical protein
LYSQRHCSITIFASRRFANHSRSRHSERNVPLRLSELPFCHGLPGSIVTISLWFISAQIRSARAMNSGPLSLRNTAGVPYCANSRSSTAITRSASIDAATSIAKHSRVHSSFTVSALSACPLPQVSCTKSYAHTWFAPVGASTRGWPVRIFRCFFLRTLNPNARHTRRTRFRFTS